MLRHLKKRTVNRYIIKHKSTNMNSNNPHCYIYTALIATEYGRFQQPGSEEDQHPQCSIRQRWWPDRQHQGRHRWHLSGPKSSKRSTGWLNSQYYHSVKVLFSPTGKQQKGSILIFWLEPSVLKSWVNSPSAAPVKVIWAEVCLPSGTGDAVVTAARAATKEMMESFIVFRKVELEGFCVWKWVCLIVDAMLCWGDWNSGDLWGFI